MPLTMTSSKRAAPASARHPWRTAAQKASRRPGSSALLEDGGLLPRCEVLVRPASGQPQPVIAARSFHEVALIMPEAGAQKDLRHLHAMDLARRAALGQ